MARSIQCRIQLCTVRVQYISSQYMHIQYNNFVVPFKHLHGKLFNAINFTMKKKFNTPFSVQSVTKSNKLLGPPSIEAALLTNKKPSSNLTPKLKCLAKIGFMCFDTRKKHIMLNNFLSLAKLAISTTSCMYFS